MNRFSWLLKLKNVVELRAGFTRTVESESVLYLERMNFFLKMTNLFQDFELEAGFKSTLFLIRPFLKVVKDLVPLMRGKKIFSLFFWGVYSYHRLIIFEGETCDLLKKNCVFSERSLDVDNMVDCQLRLQTICDQGVCGDRRRPGWRLVDYKRVVAGHFFVQLINICRDAVPQKENYRLWKFNFTEAVMWRDTMLDQGRTCKFISFSYFFSK